MRKPPRTVASILTLASGLVWAVLPASCGSSTSATTASNADGGLASCGDQSEHLLAPGYCLVRGEYATGTPDTLENQRDSDQNLTADIPARSGDGKVSVVVEIPAGTHAKWQTDLDAGRLYWELKDGAPRVVDYLGYPGDYGMIPRTAGGDGDPLDVVVLGTMHLRGSIVAAKVIGVFHLTDAGEVDDKILAVVPGEPMGEVNGMAELDASYPGVSSIVETWFTHYKGPNGGLQSGGFGETTEAVRLVDAAIAAYEDGGVP